MVTDSYWTCSDHFIMYLIVGSPCCTPETNTISYSQLYFYLKKKKKKKPGLRNFGSFFLPCFKFMLQFWSGNGQDVSSVGVLPKVG